MLETQCPRDFSHLISQSDYDYLISLSRDYFESKGLKVLRLKLGVLEVRNQEGATLSVSFFNLARSLAKLKRTEWPEHVRAHFERCKSHKDAYEFLLSDFEFAKDRLKLLVKPMNFMGELQDFEFVYKQDIPDTYTFLVLDFENQFRFLSKEDIKGWEVDENLLFTYGLENTLRQKWHIDHVTYRKHEDVYSITSADFAASLCLRVDHVCPSAIGPFGALVGLPSKSIAIASPIRGFSVWQVLEFLSPLAIKLYENEEGAIAPFFYWFYEGQFESMYIKEERPGCLRIKLPERLIEMINGQGTFPSIMFSLN